MKRLVKAGHVAVLSAVLLAVNSNGARARDLRRLENLLAPIFLAQQVGNLCAPRDASFLRDTAGANGSVNDYAEHAKFEVAHTLPVPEVTAVLRGAAELARDAAREALRAIPPEDAEQGDRRLTTFCQQRAKAVVHSAIAAHDAQHERFLRDVEEALK